jgi:hypothetical protein
MAGPWDANISRLHFTEDKSEFIAPTLDIGKEFDVCAEIELGEELRGFATAYRLVVNVQNLSMVSSPHVPSRASLPRPGRSCTPVLVDFQPHPPKETMT